METHTSLPSFKECAQRAGLSFHDLTLFQQAMTHRSYLNEHREYTLGHNERLEFLGDAVLELVVTEYLYKNYQNPEGELTSWRAALVRGETLTRVAKKLGIEKCLLMSRGEKKDTGRARQFLLANAVEALIGALYLDQGYETAKRFIEKYVLCYLPEILEKKLYLDPKSLLQQELQKREGITPSYRDHAEEGPDHEKRFVVGVYKGDECIAEGRGTSKQDAQRQAAQNALQKLRIIPT